MHPGYHNIIKEGVEIEQACPDVYDYPLVSERFSREMIEEMEHFGEWSDGSNAVRIFCLSMLMLGESRFMFSGQTTSRRI